MANASSLLFVRPSTKLVKLRYLIAAAVAGVGYALRRNYGAQFPPPAEYAFFGAAGLLLATTLFRHLSLMFTSLSSDGEKLQFEEGFLSKTSRSMNIAKVQDARVDQSFGERLMGIGTVSLESAGESGRLVMANIDAPRQVADQVLLLARQSRKAGTAPQWQ